MRVLRITGWMALLTMTLLLASSTLTRKKGLLPSSFGNISKSALGANAAFLSVAGAAETLYASPAHNDSGPNANKIQVLNVQPTPGLQLGTRRTSRRLVESSPTEFSVLVVRVTAQDGEPDFSADQLYQLIFEDDVSLKQQLHKCSFGALRLEPTSYGVLDVTIQINASGKSTYTIVSEAEDAGLDLISTDSAITRLRDFADLTMIVLPPGTLYRGLEVWAGYGTINGITSVYNNRWGGSVSTAAHEVGHNLGLRHANERGSPYADQTGYMSSAYERTGYLQQCFNAQNHWHLNWYIDRQVSVNPEDPVLLKVAAFVDYSKTTAGSEYVLVRVGQDHYFQYNRAKSFNIGTNEDKDRLTVVRDDRDGTSLLIGMNSRSINFFYVEDFEGSGKQLNIEVCAEIMGFTEDVADLMLVSVGFGESMCPSPTSAPSPTLQVVAATAAPALTPTRLPTLVPTNPDPLIQGSRTMTPTPVSVVSAAVDLTTGLTPIPTHLPTRDSTSQPSMLTDSPKFPTLGPTWTPPTRLPTLVPTTSDPMTISAVVVATTGPTLIPTNLSTTRQTPTTRGPTSQPSALTGSPEFRIGFPDLTRLPPSDRDASKARASSLGIYIFFLTIASDLLLDLG